MAIDTTIFACNVPAGAYTAGDKIAMSVIRGPSVVRDGYGDAKMKRIVALIDDGTLQGLAHIKNSNWIDDMANFAIAANGTTSLADNSPAIQRCGDISLQPNSSWEVYYEIRETVTTTTDFAVFLLVDIDYPAVAAVQNPKEQTGAPVTLYREYPMTSTIKGGSNAVVWTDYNVDIFKAGYKYLLAQTGARCTITGATLGFFSIHGAAGQAGLERIIPFVGGNINALRYGLDYSTPLVKGPMTISLACVGTNAGEAGTARLELDFIRRG